MLIVENNTPTHARHMHTFCYVSLVVFFVCVCVYQNKLGVASLQPGKQDWFSNVVLVIRCFPLLEITGNDTLAQQARLGLVTV